MNTKIEFCINPEIDFRHFSGIKYINSGTKEYHLIDTLNTEEFQRYMLEMANTGVKVEYDSVEDRYIIKNLTGL